MTLARRPRVAVDRLPHAHHITAITDRRSVYARCDKVATVARSTCRGSILSPEFRTKFQKKASLFWRFVGGSVTEWLACWTQVQKGLGANRSHDAVG